MYAQTYSLQHGSRKEWKQPKYPSVGECENNSGTSVWWDAMQTLGKMTDLSSCVSRRQQLRQSLTWKNKTQQVWNSLPSEQKRGAYKYSYSCLCQELSLKMPPKNLCLWKLRGTKSLGSTGEAGAQAVHHRHRCLWISVTKIYYLANTYAWWKWRGSNRMKDASSFPFIYIIYFRVLPSQQWALRPSPD